MGSGEGVDLRPLYEKANSGAKLYSSQLKARTDSLSWMQRASSQTSGRFNSLNK